MKMKIGIIVFFVILIGAVFYLCCPKYEIYQGETLVGNRIIIIRFNKITGTFQQLTGLGWKKLEYGNPFGYMKRP